MVKILYVEDNEQNMRLVRKILNHAGYEVIEAEDGFSGVEVAVSHMPDLILMDVNLPDITGLEATARIKESPALSHIPVIALTANSTVGSREDALKAGCDDYLSKPFQRDDLLKMVNDYLAKKV
ncbi:MAG: response regulator [Chitinophagaceae bacterium]|nr:response regulator [Anaerolineae bacterium]